MTTLMAVYNSDGCVGRCDAKCHNASGPNCDCICGGRAHGKGLRTAQEEIWRMVTGSEPEELEELKAAWQKQHVEHVAENLTIEIEVQPALL